MAVQIIGDPGQQMQVALQLRMNFAMAIYPQLVAFEYQRAYALGERKANPFGTVATDEDGEEDKAFKLAEVNVGTPARAAVAAADALLIALQLVSPINEGSS